MVPGKYTCRYHGGVRAALPAPVFAASGLVAEADVPGLPRFGLTLGVEQGGDAFGIVQIAANGGLSADQGEVAGRQVGEGGNLGWRRLVEVKGGKRSAPARR